jgi:cytosine/adenosine deaminase-related metal-dependent hydrolase
MSPLLLRAPSLLVDSRTWVEDGALLVEGGRVARIVRGPAAVRRAARSARSVDCGDVLLAPGWVNAHAHLELGAIAGRTPRGGDFGAWVRAVLQARAGCTTADFERAVAQGARASLAAGVTAVADICSTAGFARGLARTPLRHWALREVLDAHDPTRTEGALALVRRALRTSARRGEGLSPHAPFTVSPALFAAAAALARRRALPVAVHWSETEAEVAWLERGAGPLAALLGPSPRLRGLELIERAGLLRAPLALIHGNHPARGEPQRIARSGAVVVHCPGSHAWFERAPFPWRVYLDAGVRLALGTDSLASAESLDLGRELRLARAAAPWLEPRALFAMATEGGALALGQRGWLGTLAPGAHADVLAHQVRASNARAAFEQLTGAGAPLAAVWVAGRSVVRAGALAHLGEAR